MESQEAKVPPKPQKKESFKRKIYDVYSKSMITRKVRLPINAIGSGLKETLEQKIAHDIEGKCIIEGFVKPNSTKIITYSSGKITEKNFILFEVVIECDICFPVEGMLIQCVAKNITKAGIRAEIPDENNISPVVVFIARDHHYTSSYFSSINENDELNIRVIGQRFELNDKYVSVIAEIIEPKTSKKPKLVFKTDE
tara:strand:- start:76 stop:666 length:591 start_codon:yes stop_codon:yes gene_type:complete